MSCQGCGRDSETRLCCPTCIELGQTSFFCGQECFAKNWAQHSQLHDSLRRKKEDGGAPAAEASKPRPPPKETYSAYPRGMGAPLPGGMPLVKSFASQKRAAAKKSDDGAALAPGGMFSWMDQAKQIFSDRTAARETPARPNLRERSPAPQPGARAEKAPAAKARPMCSLQTGLWALIVFTVLVGGFLYLQHQRLAEESAPNGQAALSAAAAAVINVASEAKEESPAPEEGGKSSVNDLRAEISALKDLVEKHEKMLRYVMDRYVEKDVAAAPKEGAQGTKQATVANLSLTEGGVGGNVATPEVKGEARAGDAPRKRKTGAPDSSMVGMPQPEGMQ